MMHALDGRRDVAALKASHPIAGVIAGYGIALALAGQALVGRCPFHADAGRPNLHVYPSTNSYFCYRCGRGGDAIDFVMRRERLGFRAACDRLLGWSTQPAHAERCHTLPDWERLDAREQRVLDTAVAVYADRLRRTPASLAYLRSRGITDEVVASGTVGYCAGHDLAQALDANDLVVAGRLGLLGPDRRGEPQERFAGRIVVAEYRPGGAIWLIGRAWQTGGPRYLSLAGARPLLGLERIRGVAVVFLTEGVFDWLTAIGWGLSACCLCGTHGTERQFAAFEGVRRIIAVFDGDVAGREAADGLGRRFGRRWCPVPLPDGCDLNDLGCRADGKRRFFALLQAALAASGEDAPWQWASAERTR